MWQRSSKSAAVVCHKISEGIEEAVAHVEFLIPCSAHKAFQKYDADLYRRRRIIRKTPPNPHPLLTAVSGCL
eukprot:894605-Karenia_brevis.AAC.1